MQIAITFDIWNATDRAKVRRLLDNAESEVTSVPALRDGSPAAALLEALARHGGQARHGELDRELGHGRWLNAKRHLLQTGQMIQVSRGQYRLTTQAP